MIDASKFCLDIIISINALLRLYRVNCIGVVSQLDKAATTSKTTSVAAAGKVESSHHCFQVLNIAIHMYLINFSDESLRIKLLLMTYLLSSKP